MRRWDGETIAERIFFMVWSSILNRWFIVKNKRNLSYIIKHSMSNRLIYKILSSKGWWCDGYLEGNGVHKVFKLRPKVISFFCFAIT